MVVHLTVDIVHVMLTGLAIHAIEGWTTADQIPVKMKENVSVYLADISVCKYIYCALWIS